MGVIQTKIAVQIESLILYQVLLQSKDIHIQTFSLIIERLLKKGKTQDCLKFLTSQEIQSHFDQEKFDVENNIKKVTQLIKTVKEHEFSKSNYSTEIHREKRTQLIQKISNDLKIQECLKFFVRLTAIDETFIQCGSNSLNILVEMKTDLNYQFWENIRIKDTSLIGANFAKCVLSGSEFENVDISGINLDGAILFNCKWVNIRVCELFYLDGHYNEIFSLSFSPDCKSLASGTFYSTIESWDLQTGKAKNKIKLKEVLVFVCYSPYGYNLGSASGNSLNGRVFIRLFNMNTGKITRKLSGHFNAMYSVSFSPDGLIMALGGYKSICLWNVQTGQIQSYLKGKGDVCFSPDGILASICKSITLWNVKTGEQISQKEEVGIDGRSVCFSADGKTLACGEETNSISIWDVQAKLIFKQTELKNQKTAFSSVCFSDNSTLAASGYDLLIHILNIQTIEQQRLLCGHTDIINQVKFSPDGTILASCSKDRTIRLWDMKTAINRLDGHSKSVKSVCFSPDGTILASYGNDPSIFLWDAKTGKLKQLINGHLNNINSICFSPDNTKLASNGDIGYFRIWNVKTGKLESELHVQPLNAQLVSFTLDSKSLVLYYLNMIVLWNLKEEQKQQLKIDKYLNPLYFSPNGTTLAFIDEKSNGIQLVELKAGSSCWVHVPSLAINSACISIDGNKLALSYTNEIQLMDVQTGKLEQLTGHKSQIFSLCFSPDSVMLASGSGLPENCIFLWNTKTGELISKLSGHTNQVNSICFSPDSATLVSGSSDSSIRFWDIKKGSSFFTKCYDQSLQAYLQQKNPQNIGIDVIPIITTSLILTDKPIIQAQGALIFQSVFSNHLGMNILRLLEQKGSIILEKQKNELY